MKSQNFEFLRPKRAVLADLAGFAERYAHADPASSLIKQRSFVEQVVAAIYERYRLRPPYSRQPQRPDERRAVPRSRCPRSSRTSSTPCARPATTPRTRDGPITSQLSLECLAQLFDIARWFHVQVDGGELAADARSTRRRRPSRRARRQDEGGAREAAPRRGEVRVGARRARGGDARSGSKPSAPRPSTRRGARAARRREGQKVASFLAVQRGDDAPPPDRPGAARRRLGRRRQRREHRARCARRFSSPTMPTPSGDGFADYVLYGDDGKPLAVIEAKKTAKDARVGAEQARMLRRRASRRRPASARSSSSRTASTSSSGTTRRATRTARSTASTRRTASSTCCTSGRTRSRSPRSSRTSPSPTACTSSRRSSASASGSRASFRKALLVQATGTGKTRVAISLCDVLMRAGWVKRILFLCDRRELRKQADRVFKEFLPGEPRVIVDSSDRRATATSASTSPPTRR